MFLQILFNIFGFWGFPIVWDDLDSVIINFIREQDYLRLNRKTLGMIFNFVFGNFETHL